MQSENSVSVQLCRGDYLRDQHSKGLADLCTMEYYTNSIEHINLLDEDQHFYIFTDNPTWISENFKLENAIYLQNNTSSNSWQDMHLKSHCKCNIIANNSFSWWSTWLNSSPRKIVIAPKSCYVTLKAEIYTIEITPID